MNRLTPAEAFMVDYSVVSNIDISADSPVNGQNTQQFGQNSRLKLLTMIPQLRAFARMLTGDKDCAETLSLETMAEAWRARFAIGPETNLRAWLFTIARNKFHSSRGDEWHEAPLVDQLQSANFSDTTRALRSLPDRFREALVLVSASGCSYEEAAQICGCPVGTVKSRVFRARQALVVNFDTMFL